MYNFLYGISYFLDGVSIHDVPGWVREESCHLTTSQAQGRVISNSFFRSHVYM